MINKRVMLEEGNEHAYLDVYAAQEIKDFKRSAILIIPGGGYGMCAPREGEPIAMAFLSHGFNAFVLNYSAGHKAFPAHLIEASMAVKHIRDNAEEYRIDPDKVFVVGFSAGGHLAASLGTMWDRQEIYDAVTATGFIGHTRPGAGTNLEFLHAGLDKLCAVEDENGTIRPKIKISENVAKITIPHYKKVYRQESQRHRQKEIEILLPILHKITLHHQSEA